MRAAIFADQLHYAQPGGIGTYLRHLIPGLAGRMEAGKLILAHHGPRDAGLFADVEGVEERRLPGRRDLTGLCWHGVGRPVLEAYLGELDLVHAPSLVYPPSRAPLVATVHDLCICRYPNAFPARWRVFHRRGLSLILRHAGVILVDSRSTRDDLRSLTGRADPRVKVVGLGVDAPPRPSGEEVERVLSRHGLRPPYILFVGTIEPRKNLCTLARAYASFGGAERLRSGELVLAGPLGWMRRGEMSRILGQQGVRWLGYLPQDELEAVYAAATVFAYPSLYEGFGLPVLEAMARGLAVVTSNTSSLREVGEGVALLVDPEDPMEMGKALRRLIEDPDLREELAQKGRERAAEYSWESTVEKTLRAYREAL